jgi:hypothetical protein
VLNREVHGSGVDRGVEVGSHALLIGIRSSRLERARDEKTLIARSRPSNRGREGFPAFRQRPHPEVTEVVELGAQEEDAVEEEHGVLGHGPARVPDGLVGAVIEDTGAVEPAAARSQRLEQLAAERLVVEGVPVVPVGRSGAATVTLPARAVEAVDRRPQPRAPPVLDQRVELVRKRRLAGGVHAVDPDPDDVRPTDLRNEVRETTESRLTRSGVTPISLNYARRGGSTRVAKGDGL